MTVAPLMVSSIDSGGLPLPSPSPSSSPSPGGELLPLSGGRGCGGCGAGGEGGLPLPLLPPLPPLLPLESVTVIPFAGEIGDIHGGIGSSHPIIGCGQIVICRII